MNRNIKPTSANAMNDIPLPCPAEKILPHRGPMLFLQRLDRYTANEAATSIEIGRDHLFLSRSGRLDPLAFVEMLAQLMAAHQGYTALQSESAGSMGYLVGIKHFELKGTAKAGDRLFLEARNDTQFEKVTYIEGSVKKGETVLAQGSLKLWQQDAAPSAAGISPAPFLPAKEVRSARAWDEWRNASLLHRCILDCIEEAKDTPSSGEALLFLKPDFIPFQGHFPAYPLLPGVMMLKIALVLSELAVDRPLLAREIRLAKFSRTILPGARIRARLDRIQQEDGLLINATLLEKENVCSKITLLVSEEDRGDIHG